MYKSEREKENNAQRARRDSNFTDSKAKIGKERGISGTEHEVTRYSDGSSTHHFGGPCGSSDYDENGEEWWGQAENHYPMIKKLSEEWDEKLLKENCPTIYKIKGPCGHFH